MLSFLVLSSTWNVQLPFTETQRPILPPPLDDRLMLFFSLLTFLVVLPYHVPPIITLNWWKPTSSSLVKVCKLFSNPVLSLVSQLLKVPAIATVVFLFAAALAGITATASVMRMLMTSTRAKRSLRVVFILFFLSLIIYFNFCENYIIYL